MIRVFCKESENMLLNMAKLSTVEIQLINECKEAFECETKLLYEGLNYNLNLNLYDYEDIKSYHRLEVLIHDTHVKCLAMIDKMKKNQKYNYNFLDLLLYNSINVYLNNDKYGFETFDEFKLPIVKTILSEFWNEFTFENFPYSYEYFSNNLKDYFPIDGEVIIGYSDLLTYHMNIVIKFKESYNDTSRGNIIEFINSISWLIENGVNISLSNKELNLLALFDFNKFDSEDINTLINIPYIIFKYSNLNNANDFNNSLFKKIVKNVFEYLNDCSRLFEIKKECSINLAIDKYNYTDNELYLESSIRIIPFEKICDFYDNIDYELNVNNVLTKLLQTAYYRQYKRKLESIITKFSSKNVLEMSKSIPF